MKKFMLVLTVAAVLFGAFALTGCNGKECYGKLQKRISCFGNCGSQLSTTKRRTRPTFMRVSATALFRFGTRGRVGTVRCGDGKRFRRNGGQT